MAMLPATRRAVAADAPLVATLRGGAVVLMRHTQTEPGVGDPPGWQPGACASQRNLNAMGTAHAERIGRWFAAQGLTVDRVRNSPWCRTRDTARLAFGRSEDWPALGNIYEDRSASDAQAAEARLVIDRLQRGQLVVWVSHGVTIAHIAGAAGAGLAPGEAVVLRRGDRPGAPAVVLGRLQVP